MMNDTNKASVAGAFITGAALGMATALLIAPKRGKDTRQDIKRNLQQTRDKINDTVACSNETAKTKLNQTIDTAKIVAKEGSRAAKEAKDRVKQHRTEEEDKQPEE